MPLTSSDRDAVGKTFRIIFLAGIFLVTGCAGQRLHRVSPPPLPPPHTPAETPASQSVQILLEADLVEWKGVPYRLGGSSRKGIDCSAFVRLIFFQRFGISLPRTTSEQALVGKQVLPGGLASGDLVFFRIGSNRRHVGIYLGDGRFMHVSLSHGVIDSDLSSSYWQRHFWQARRVLSGAGRMVAGE